MVIYFVTPSKRFVRTAVLGIVLLTVGFQKAVFGEEPSTAGTFQETILTVQADKGRLVAPTNGVISIPYTRIDVAVDNGIAATRLLQVLHNHGQTNQGFAVALPVLPDTTITHFNLWDQGHRYAGAIEERTRAEAAYKEVTGEEAPTMQRDPGLVRRAGNRYELRVFPIQPGEDKQVELFSHRRLGMVDGEFELMIPVAELAASYDSRHGTVCSEIVEVSVLLRDELPIKSVSVTGAEMKEVFADEHQRLLTLRAEAGKVPDVRVRYAVKVASIPAMTTQVYSHEGNQYFLLRILGRADRSVAGSRTPEVFYIGVWRPETVGIHTNGDDTGMGMLELPAYITLGMLRREDLFHGSYWPPKYEGQAAKQMPQQPRIGTHQLHPAANVSKAMEDAYGPFEDRIKSKLPADIDVLQHLRDALRDKQCRFVYLFLGQLPSSTSQALVEIIHQHSKQWFILVTEAGGLPATITDQPNVSHFSFRDGWRAVRHPLPADGRELLMTQEWGLDELLGGIGLTNHKLVDFWQKLPNLGASLPKLVMRGPVRLRDVQVFPAQADISKSALAVIWLSGRYEGAGRVDFELSLPSGGPNFLETTNSASPIVVRAATVLNDQCRQNRLAGAFHARQIADGLAAQIGALNQSTRGRSAMVAGKRSEQDRAARLVELRKEVVRLSKTFSFITGETAFIALPPDLQKKYGFTPQEQAAQQYYGGETPPANMYPEPSTLQLLIAGALGLAWWRRNTRTTVSAKQPRFG